MPPLCLIPRSTVPSVGPFQKNGVITTTNSRSSTMATTINIWSSLFQSTDFADYTDYYQLKGNTKSEGFNSPELAAIEKIKLSFGYPLLAVGWFISQIFLKRKFENRNLY